VTYVRDLLRREVVLELFCSTSLDTPESVPPQNDNTLGLLSGKAIKTQRFKLCSGIIRLVNTHKLK